VRQEWSEESHLEMMKAFNVKKCYLSVSTPGVHLKQGEHELARKLARYVNDVAADLKKRRPDQFGFFASLPLADIEGCMQEIPRALDELNADGFVVLTNFHGTYLGHKDFDALFDELNRRKAKVFIHPTTPCLHSGTKATPLDFPRPMFEFLFDTARAVINLFLTGTIKRCPDITFLLSHCGGTFPPLINRFASAAPIMKLGGAANELSPAYVKARLNSQFYFDTAGWAFPEMAKGLLEYITVDRMLYGSDFPYTPMGVVGALSEEHDIHLPKVFASEEERQKLCSQNAMQLFKK
jgi:6-methylsalicylate decarboxylase